MRLPLPMGRRDGSLPRQDHDEQTARSPRTKCRGQRQRRRRTGAGARQPPRRGLRGRRALPGPGRVPRAGDARGHGRDRPGRRDRRGGRVRRRPDRSRSCASPTAAARSPAASPASRRPSRCSKPSGVLAIAGTAPGLRLLRDQRRLGAAARALPHPRPRHPARRRPDRPRDRLGRTRRARRRRAAARRRPARDLPPAPGYKVYFDAAPAPPSSACATSASSSASTTPWSAASSPGAGTCRSGSPSRSSATTPRTPTAWPAMVATADMVAHYCAGRGDLAGAAAGGRRALRPRPESAARAPLRASLPAPRRPAGQRALPAVGARARRPAPPLRGHGLQADRRRDAALGLDDPHPPAQRLRQDRRRRPRAGVLTARDRGWIYQRA